MNQPPETIQLPAQLSTYAPEHDWLYYFIFWISVTFFVAIVGVMGWFVVKYRRQDGVKAKPTGHNTPLEVLWTFTPLILLWFLFSWGFESYVHAAVAPADAIDIRVKGAQWNFEFEYPSGATEGNELTVPANTPVRLIMSSKDVLHSFYVPEFRIKKDIVPGMYTTMWFEATQEGDVQVFCTEYCGAPAGGTGNVGHSAMLGKIHVVSPEAYEKHVRSLDSVPEGMTPAEYGEQLYVSNGCVGCHKVDGETMMPAPNWKGLWGKSRQFVGGEQVVADAEYIKNSILNPQSQIVEGYQNVVMPPYQLRDFQLDSIVAYIKELSGVEPGADGATPAESGDQATDDAAATGDGEGTAADGAAAGASAEEAAADSNEGAAGDDADGDAAAEQPDADGADPSPEG